MGVEVVADQMNLDQRREYGRRTLDASDLGADPIAAFGRWLDEALAHPDIDEALAMTIATVDANGVPDARIVLLRDYTSGFVFFTNYSSRKGTQLTTNPHAALVFYWPALERQVRVTGAVTKTSADESDEYFDSRPHRSKLGAIVSNQSQSGPLSRSDLEARLSTLEQQYPTSTSPPRPEHWGGFRLLAERIEFYQGQRSRMHDRIEFKRSGNKWEINRLDP